MKRGKYNAVPTVVDGFRFDSQKEARHYGQLKLAVQSGDLMYFLRQVPFHLPGGVRYVVDFVEFWRGEEPRYVDVKGFKTASFKVKVRMVEALYPVKIICV